MRVSIAKSEKRKIMKITSFLDLAKSSKDDHHFVINLPMADLHLKLHEEIP
jgi:hypothetical protein